MNSLCNEQQINLAGFDQVDEWQRIHATEMKRLVNKLHFKLIAVIYLNPGWMPQSSIIFLSEINNKKNTFRKQIANGLEF